ncbi:MAG: immune inhibitor A [Anaerolineae bacterium]|nr:immune inhibitor A [Anaerolineae bacterium]
MRIIRLLLPVILLIALAACRSQAGTPASGAKATAVTAVPAEAATPTSTATPPASATPAPASASPAATSTPAGPPTWPAPQPLPSPFAIAPLTAAEIEAAQALAAASAPERDDVTLAIEFLRITEVPAPAGNAEQLAAGSTASFSVLNTDSNTYSTIEAVLVGSSESAHFWFDTTEEQPEATNLAPFAAAFDEIYNSVIAAFGPETNPGIDGDPRLHILHASPAALCDDADSCNLLGYFSSSDGLPRAVARHSNERDMFIMNARTFGTGSYLNVLAHEFRHMIEDNYDKADIDWEVEGSAMLAEELAGYTDNAHARANAFLAQPDQQLNSWTDGRTTPYYGMAYLMNRYLYDRLGPELYRAFAAHPDDGLDAVTAVAAAAGLPVSGQSLWEDWQVALALHDHPQAPAQYRLGDGNLESVSATSVAGLPAVFTTTVSQYAGDYYRLEGEGQVTITFNGAQRVPLLDVGAASGERFWYAHRANYSQPSLTRNVDLSEVASATLTYEVYHDIETGYDFAYVAVSADGGQTWQGLTGEQMQGLAPEDDPAGRAFAPRFYTGKSEGWVHEQMDLTPYAGQEILLRFSYVTDPILTFGGLALDNIAIPEIGLVDDAEGDNAGWRPEGFSQVTATLPQPWHLQLITFPAGVPQVMSLPVSAEGSAATAVNLNESASSPVLIISASAPLTPQPAHYQLEFAP